MEIKVKNGQNGPAINFQLLFKDIFPLGEKGFDG